MTLDPCWIAVASLVVPGVLTVLLRRTAVNWLPSALLLVHAAAAFVIAVLLLVTPDIFFDEATVESSLMHGFGVALAFVVAGLFSMWATFVGACGAVAAIVTARWRVRRGLPTRFGANWPRKDRGAAWGDTAGNDVSESDTPGQSLARSATRLGEQVASPAQARGPNPLD